MSGLAEQLMASISGEPGVDYASGLVRKKGARAALNNISALRDAQSAAPGLDQRDMQLADRAAEGARLRDILGPVAPVAGAAGVMGYEGLVKPALGALPAGLKDAARRVPGLRNFVPDDTSAPVWDEDMKNRIAAYILGTTGGL